MDNLIVVDSFLINPAGTTCSEAFKDDIYINYLIPDVNKRCNLHFLFEYYLRTSIAGKSEVYTTSTRCEGVAVWHDSDQRAPFSSLFVKENFTAVFKCGLRFLWRGVKAESYIMSIKREYAPQRHMYLALLAVMPGYQGKGYAGALLKPMLRRLDNEGIACYLETQNLKNVALYTHFGFRNVYKGMIPGTSLPMYAMLREANTVTVKAFNEQLSTSPA